LLRINYSTAKTILRVYRKESRVDRKYRCNEIEIIESQEEFNLNKEINNEGCTTNQFSSSIIQNTVLDRGLTYEETLEKKMIPEEKRESDMNVFFQLSRELNENGLYNIANKLYTKINSKMMVNLKKNIGNVLLNYKKIPMEGMIELLNIMNEIEGLNGILEWNDILIDSTFHFCR
jgi:hypothetical protein